MAFVPQNVCFKEEKRAPQFETYPIYIYSNRKTLSCTLHLTIKSGMLPSWTHMVIVRAGCVARWIVWKLCMNSTAMTRMLCWPQQVSTSLDQGGEWKTRQSIAPDWHTIAGWDLIEASQVWEFKTDEICWSIWVPFSWHVCSFSQQKGRLWTLHYYYFSDSCFFGRLYYMKKGIPNLPICFYVDLVITQLMSIVAQYAHRIQHDAHEPHSGPSCPPQILDLYNSRKGSSLVYLWAGVGHGMWQTRASSIMFKVGNINSISSLKLHMRKLKHSGFKLKSTIHPFPQCRLLCLRCHC